MIKIGIVGGTGYTGVELLRLLTNHPNTQVEIVTSRAEAGKAVSDLFPNLRKHYALNFSNPSQTDFSQCDFVFFATPNGVAMKTVPTLLEKNIKVIDLSADFRLKEVAVWEKWYGMKHSCPELLADAVYGLAEINQVEISKANLVANPGCYPTGILLSLIPLLQTKIIDTQRLIADVKSGSSGAGRKANVGALMSEVGESFKAYNISGHRHWPEICQILNIHADNPVEFTFVPHLVPMIRGIEATLYATLLQDVDLATIQTILLEFYQNKPFVDILPLKSHPETRNVRSTNICQLSIHHPPENNRLLIISAVIDNLVKGAAGQAIQNMNIMSGLPENMGLNQVGLLP